MDAMIYHTQTLTPNIQDSDGTNSESPLVLSPWYDDYTDSDTTSLNSEPLFQEDDYATSDSDRDQLNEIPTNNNDKNFILNDNKNPMIMMHFGIV